MKKPGLKAGYGQQVFDRMSNLEGSFKKATANSKEEIELLKKRISLFEEKLNKIDSNNVIRNGPYQGALGLGLDSLLNPVLNPVLDPGYNTEFNTFQDNINAYDTILPPVGQIKMLIDMYFDKVNPMFPILCPTNTIPKLLESSKTITTPLLLGVIPTNLQLLVLLLFIFRSCCRLSNINWILSLSNYLIITD